MKYSKCILLLLLTNVLGFSQNIVLDSAFGDNGRVNREIGNDANAYANAVLIQPNDHKILVTGKNTHKSRLFNVVRYLSDGQIDEEFDCSSTEADPPSGTTEATCLALQTDNKIIIGGLYSSGKSNFAISRLLPDGQPDSSFGNAGVAITDFGENAGIYGIAVDPVSGKIVAVGYTSDGFENMAVARYKPDGSLDSTFSQDGIFVLSKFIYDDRATSVVIQSDGKTVVAGFSDVGFYDDYALFRLTESGTLDSTFHVDGIVSTNLGTPYNVDRIMTLLLQDDGTILACGQSQIDNTGLKFSVVKYQTDGYLDTSFGNNGVVKTSLTSFQDLCSAAYMLANGDFLLCGSIYDGENHQFAAVKYHPNGEKDISFANQGVFINSMDLDNVCNAVACLPDGSAILTGKLMDSAGESIVLQKLNHNGTIASSFGKQGFVQNGIGGTRNSPRSIVRTNDGKFILAGYAVTGGFRNIALAKYNVDGSPDYSFSCNGEVSLIQFDDIDRYGESIDVQPGGKILVSGYSTDGSTENFLICRLEPGGTLDESFGVNGFFIYPEGGSGSKIIYYPSTEKIYFAGKNKIFRLSSNGVLDNSFGTGGVSLSNIYIQDFQIQPDGSLLVAGRILQSGKYAIAVQHFFEGGTQDMQFGTTGTAIIKVVPGNNSTTDIELKDGKILVAAFAESIGFALIRLTSAGLLDDTFGDGDGIVTSPGIGGAPNTIMLQPGGRILVGGIATNPTGIGLACYNEDGSPYLSYGVNGVAVIAGTYPTGFIDLGNNSVAVCGNQSAFDLVQLKPSPLSNVATPESSLQNVRFYPNPVESSFVVEYALEKGQGISVDLFDLLGRKVQTLLPYQFKMQGKHQATLILSGRVPSGNYIIQFQADEMDKAFLLLQHVNR